MIYFIHFQKLNNYKFASKHKNFKSIKYRSKTDCDTIAIIRFVSVYLVDLKFTR